MKKKFFLSFFVISVLSTFAVAQADSTRMDSVKPAKQVILDNPGEKKLATDIRKDQLKRSPEILKSDSSRSPAGKRHKCKHCKHSKSGK